MTETWVDTSAATNGRAPREGIRTGVIEEAGGFAALEGEWGGLYAASPKATPFQSWAWLYSWWEHYGDGLELRIVTVRDGDLLVGLLPLVLERRWGLPGRLLFAGTGPTDYLDMLAREGWEEAVAGACLKAIEGMGGWAVVDLHEMKPGALAPALEAGWAGPKIGLRQSGCPFTDVGPWEEMTARLKPKRRSSVRQAIRRAGEDGLATRLVGAGEAGRAARRLVALHRESWQGRGIGVEHMSPRFEAFVEAIATRLTERGLGVISEFRRDDEEAVISHFLILGRDFVGGYMIGADRGATKRYQFSSLCMWDEWNVARDRDLPRVDELRGEEAYKLRWSSGVAHNHRAILARNRAVLAAYDGYRELRSKIEAYVDSEDAPRWATNAVLKYRDLRTKASGHAGGRSG